jgi:hypothetical protein
MDLAATHLPTAAPKPQPGPEPTGAASAKAYDAPAIRFGPTSHTGLTESASRVPASMPNPSSPPDPTRPGPIHPPGTDDFLFEERVRTVLDRILRTDALRHGLTLGER